MSTIVGILFLVIQKYKDGPKGQTNARFARKVDISVEKKSDIQAQRILQSQKNVNSSPIPGPPGNLPPPLQLNGDENKGIPTPFNLPPPIAEDLLNSSKNMNLPPPLNSNSDPLVKQSKVVDASSYFEVDDDANFENLDENVLLQDMIDLENFDFEETTDWLVVEDDKDLFADLENMESMLDNIALEMNFDSLI